MVDSVRLAETLTARFRVALKADAQEISDSKVACVRATDISAPNGFVVRVTSSWRSVEAEFVPDSFAGQLIRSMGSSDELVRHAFAKVAQALVSMGGRVWLRINQTAVTDFEVLPAAPWKTFELRVHRMSAAETEGPGAVLLAASEVAAACLALVLALLPLEDDDAAAHALFESGLPEGARTRVEVNRYERNPVNRAVCIASHGALCCVCDQDFGRTYGILGAGYIEVHHLVPVSRMGAGYVVDPVRDLVPLCANCHAMVHRRDPPVPITELKAILANARGH
jgi:5-methylcytosine-specific restriction protein A